LELIISPNIANTMVGNQDDTPEAK